MAVAVEAIASNGNGPLYFGLFVGGPLLYGLYAFLLAPPLRGKALSLMAAIHVLCFGITLWQRDVFSVL